MLPIHAFLDDRYLHDRGLRNYWGYNTLSFFAPEMRYSDANPINDFRMAVAALHDAGIEVILDVVYNHTAEGNHLGPTLCYRGIDNSSYYWLLENEPRYYEDFTGTGNAIKVRHPRVLQMVMDSLRLWVEAFHVDGFRFDLASTLGRGPEFDRNAPFFAAVQQDPVLAKIKLIAEPWDLGVGGYQVGGFPVGWSEWNDIYRRTLRRFVFPMTVAFFLWYALYVILSAYARDFMGTRLFGSNINIALVFGLLQFVSTFVIAWLYARTRRDVTSSPVDHQDDAMPPTSAAPR